MHPKARFRRNELTFQRQSVHSSDDAGLHAASIYAFSAEKCASGLTKLAGKGN